LGSNGSVPRQRDPRATVISMLIVLSSVLLLLGVVAGYVRDTFLDSDEAGDLAVAALEKPEVRAAVSAAIVDQIVALDQELLTVRPLIEVVVDGVLASPQFAEMVRFGVTDLHRTVFTEGNDTLSVRLTEVVFATKVSLAKIDPELAELIPNDVIDGLITVSSDPLFVDGVQAAESARVLAFVLPLLSALGFGLVVVLAEDRRRAITALGLSAIVVAIVLLVLSVIGRALFVVGYDDDARRVAGAIWDVGTAGLATLGLATAGVGTLLAFAASADRQRAGLGSQVRVVGRLFEPPETRKGRLSFAAIAILLGVSMVTAPEATLRLVMTITGMGMVVAGLTEAVTAVSGAVAPRRAPTGGAARPSWYWWVGGGLTSAALLAVLLTAIYRSGGSAVTAGSGGPGCNGSVLLCDRPLDQVAFATTHNSMAAAEDGFSFNYQTVGMVPQLDDGYRGFLIDAYFGIESDELVVTDRGPVTAEERQELVNDVGEGAVASAEALRESLVTSGSERGVYLCHSFCEVGAISMIDEMKRVREWLDANPREVIVLVIQDEGPTEQDIEDVFEASGLTSYLHSQPLAEPWPTLQEMIESGRRVWVSAENRSGEEAWYHDAFTFIQDTPYSQPDKESFTCELLRGDPDSPLFLVNHWLSPASPTSADEVNARAVLEARLEQCDDQRGPFVNMVAVDFSDRGDVVAFVAEINGVARP
jgi:hypothetical protein